MQMVIVVVLNPKQIQESAQQKSVVRVVASDVSLIRAARFSLRRWVGFVWFLSRMVLSKRRRECRLTYVLV